MLRRHSVFSHLDPDGFQGLLSASCGSAEGPNESGRFAPKSSQPHAAHLPQGHAEGRELQGAFEYMKSLAAHLYIHIDFICCGSKDILVGFIDGLVCSGLQGNSFIVVLLHVFCFNCH